MLQDGRRKIHAEMHKKLIKRRLPPIIPISTAYTMNLGHIPLTPARLKELSNPHNHQQVNGQNPAAPGEQRLAHTHRLYPGNMRSLQLPKPAAHYTSRPIVIHLDFLLIDSAI